MSPLFHNLKLRTKLPIIFTLVFSIVVSCFSLLTGFIDTLSYSKRQPEVSSENILFLGALTRSQGITTNGESFYFSSKFSLIKTGLDGITFEKANYMAIPKDLKDKYALAHIGGISYYNGKIYAALEDSKVWDYPVIALYDSESLEFLEYHILPAENHDHGLPWVAVDAERGYIYAAPRDNAAFIYAYSLSTFTLVKTIDISEPVHKIQGGEMYKGMLYVATNNDTQAVYEINPSTGAARKYFDRNLTRGSEGEGITVLETSDGAVFHAIDMGPLFINAFIRHYKAV